MNTIIRYFNTIRYLKPSQIFYQVYRRTARRKVKSDEEYPGQGVKGCPLLLEELDLEPKYLSRFCPKRLCENEITLLNQSFCWRSGDWNNPDASHLWNFNLHYFEYGIALAAFYKREGDNRYRRKLLELINDWIRHVKDGDGWQPYTISLRIPNWLIAFEILGERVPPEVLSGIYTQYRWLLCNQEKHLLGNHYFENLKTILICSHLFDEEERFRSYLKRFIKEIKREILLDGVHFERSLMYHKIILEDIIRIALLLENRKEKELPFLLSVIEKMNTALYSLERGMGKTPHFNDAGNNIAKSADQLCRAVKGKWGIRPAERTAFPEAGYYKLYPQNASLLFDCGPPGPRYMCGHAHCDALSFELSIEDVPILVNAGTYQYQDKRRAFFRSTKAHNTVVIGGEEQSELWGEHRAARRIRKVRCRYEKDAVQGSYMTYRGRYHERRIRIEKGPLIEIRDRVKGPADTSVSAFFRAAPGLRWEREAENGYALVRREKQKTELKLTFSAGKAFVHREGEICAYGESFGRLESSEVLELRYGTGRGAAENRVELRIEPYDTNRRN